MMIKRFFTGILISSLVIVIPSIGASAILCTAHIWILWIFGVLASILQPAYNPFTITVKAKDGGTGAQIIWSVYITQLGLILESAYLRYPESVEWDIPACIALLGMAAGLALRSWAVLKLGKFFTLHIEIQEGHTVIRTGPYRFVRHPSYLGAFLLYISTTVFFHTWFSMCAALILLPLAFYRRICYEDRMLIKEFGNEYESYRLAVKGFIPGIW